jgi:hypothetical protein
MTGRYTEVSPDDVIWSNLGLNPYEIKVRSNTRPFCFVLVPFTRPTTLPTAREQLRFTSTRDWEGLVLSNASTNMINLQVRTVISYAITVAMIIFWTIPGL